MFVTGREAVIQNSYQYDAFGAEAEVYEQFPNRIRYTGQQYDELTGQYYLRARYYDPLLGRFMQEDVYQGDGLNLYAYCHNNPVKYYDPSGYIETSLTGDGCPSGGNINSGDNDDEIGRADNQKGLDDIIDVMKDGEIAGRNIISQLEDGTRVIFRMDTGEFAHSIGSYYPDPVDHINIEMHVPTPRGGYNPKLDIHIMLNACKEVIKVIFTGDWSKK